MGSTIKWSVILATRDLDIVYKEISCETEYRNISE